MIRPLIDRTMDCVQRSLDDARLTAAQIDRVVLVGGSTRTPMIGELLEARLGRPARKDINPDLCVALGAAVQGAMIAGESVGAVLVDITPHSMGIKTLDPNSGTRTRLVSAASFGRYSPTGHLIVERRGRLEAAPFSLATITTTEPTRPIVSVRPNFSAIEALRCRSTQFISIGGRN